MNDAAEIPISEMGGGGLQRCVYYKRRPERIGARSVCTARSSPTVPKHVLIHTRRDGFFRSILT